MDIQYRPVEPVSWHLPLSTQRRVQNDPQTYSHRSKYLPTHTGNNEPGKVWAVFIIIANINQMKKCNQFV